MSTGATHRRTLFNGYSDLQNYLDNCKGSYDEEGSHPDVRSSQTGLRQEVDLSAYLQESEDCGDLDSSSVSFEGEGFSNSLQELKDDGSEKEESDNSRPSYEGSLDRKGEPWGQREVSILKKSALELSAGTLSDQQLLKRFRGRTLRNIKAKMLSCKLIGEVKLTDFQVVQLKELSDNGVKRVSDKALKELFPNRTPEDVTLAMRKRKIYHFVKNKWSGQELNFLQGVVTQYGSEKIPYTAWCKYLYNRSNGSVIQRIRILRNKTSPWTDKETRALRHFVKNHGVHVEDRLLEKEFPAHSASKVRSMMKKFKYVKDVKWDEAKLQVLRSLARKYPEGVPDKVLREKFPEAGPTAAKGRLRRLGLCPRLKTVWNDSAVKRLKHFLKKTSGAPTDGAIQKEFPEHTVVAVRSRIFRLKRERARAS